MKRLYQNAEVQPVAGGFAVLLDGRPVRTPAGALFVVPGQALARAMAAEWNSQGETVQPATMPMTQFAGTTLDRVATQRDGVVENLLRYVLTDMVCHVADQPPDLARRQRAAWQPLLAWASETLGITLVVTTGVLPVGQPPEATAAAARAISTLDDFELTAMATLSGLSGSLVVAMAVMQGRLDAAGAFDVSQIDELWQAEQWGEDDEALERRRHLKREIDDAVRFLGIVRA